MRRRSFLQALTGLPLMGVAATLAQEEKVLGAFRYTTPDEQAEAIKNGWNDQQFFGKRWIKTTKLDKATGRDRTVLAVVHRDPHIGDVDVTRHCDFVGKQFTLEEETLYVRREAYMLEFFAYETPGAVVDYAGNLKQLAQAKFV